MEANFLASLNGFVIYVSVMLAITKFFGDRHAAHIFKLQDTIRSIDFPDANGNPLLQSLKDERDNFLNQPVQDFGRLVAGLFLMLIAYPLMQILVITGTSANGWLKMAIAGVFLLLFLTSIWIAIQLWRMYRKNITARRRANELKTNHQLVKSLIQTQ